MSRLLLDTTFLIDVERSDTDLDAVIRDDDEVAIAAITVAELTVGIQLALGRTVVTADRRAFEDLPGVTSIGYRST